MEQHHKQKKALLSDDTKKTLVRYYEQGMDNYNKGEECCIGFCDLAVSITDRAYDLTAS